MAANGDDDVPNNCGTCGKEGSEDQRLFLCTGCRKIKYCGRRCQKMDRACQAYHLSPTTQEEYDASIKHMVQAVFEPEDTHGFVYTYGVAATHPSKVEFISLDVARDDVPAVHACFNFLALRVQSGHEIFAGQSAVSGQCAASDVEYLVVDVNDDIKLALLVKYAVRCARDVNLLLIMPVAKLPVALPREIVMHKWKIATTSLELGLWRSKLVVDGVVDGEAGMAREQCRATCGADVIIPGVLPFLTGIELGERAAPTLVGERNLTLRTIGVKLRNQCRPAPGDEEPAGEYVPIFDHQIIYNTCHPHPSGKSSMQRNKFIRFLNGDQEDVSPTNLAECSFYDAFVHIDDWATDWTFFVTDEEERFVRNNVELMKRLFDLGQRSGR